MAESYFVFVGQSLGLLMQHIYRGMGPVLPRDFATRGNDVRLKEALEALAAADTRETRFYCLGAAAKASYDAGDFDDARKYAIELQALTPEFRNSWNYGNAVQAWNIVLGRLALRDGKTAEAKRFLLAAGRSPSSPQLDSFGPNVSLANDLLAKGEKEVVLQYFEECDRSWTMGKYVLKFWTNEIKSGRTPNFASNLVI